MVSPQAAGINGTELDAPQTGSFSEYGYAPFSEQVFNIPVAQVETVIQPDCVANNIGWESVAFVGVHAPILAITGI